MVQKSMVQRLSSRNRQLRDLGVKQAPFVVLIGASMPSVLAEIAFVTNKLEGSLLKTAAYRQQVAEALFTAVLRYQQSLKKMRSTAMAEPTAR
jgi:N-acetylmuramoyl-L-alanine amidase